MVQKISDSIEAVVEGLAYARPRALPSAPLIEADVWTVRLEVGNTRYHLQTPVPNGPHSN